MTLRTVYTSLLFMLLGNLHAQDNGRCSVPDLVFEGILTDNSATRPVVTDIDGDMPAVGDRGDLSKKFEEKLFGGMMSGWMSIGYAEVVAVNGRRCTLKILEKKTSVQVNGKEKNLFVAGRTVKFEKYSPATPQPYEQKDENGKVIRRGFTLCGKYTGAFLEFYSDGTLKSEYTLNEKEEVEGPVKIYHPNGKLRETGTYKAGKRNGYFESWYENGNREAEAMLENDAYHGTYREYNEKGELIMSGSYKNNAEDGVWQFFENGKMLREGSISNKQEDGLWKYYDEEGNLKQSGYYLKGERNGEWTSFYPGGKPKMIITYKDGRQEGLQTKYYENGNISEVFTLTRSGQRTGEYLTYHENGNPQIKTRMNGTGGYSGEYLSFYADGKPETIGMYDVTGNKTGTWITYDAKGRKTKTKYSKK